jgi:FkbM family methyltransferase
MANINFFNILKCIWILFQTSTIPKNDWILLVNSIFLTLLKHPDSIFRKKTKEPRKHFLTDYLHKPITVKSSEGIIFVARPKFEDLARFLFSHVLAKWEPISEINVREGQVIIDVGANVGYYTIQLSKKIGSTGKIIAIEPDTDTFDILRQNCNLNNLNNVELQNVAVGAKNEKIKLFRSDTHSGISSLVENVGSNSITIDAITLDGLLGDKYKKINWVKIDVEGYEVFVLKGAEKSLSRIETILIEIHEEILRQNDQSPQDVIQILKESGFAIHTFQEYWDKENSQNQSLKSDYILGTRL